MKAIISIFALFALSLSLISCGTKGTKNNTLKVGHSGGYLSAAVYAADTDADLQQFRVSSDIAYALLSGSLDAGFVDADRLPALALLDGFNKLIVMGKVTYPYGATLVVRKGLNVRLNELNGLTVAASAPDCKLLKAFVADAERLGADLSDVKYKYITFDAMLPALEAGTVDAVIIKGTYSVFALYEGHIVLYQNWEVEPGDGCCPAVVDQIALVLLVRNDKTGKAKKFINALISAQSLAPDELRRAVTDNTAIPLKILQEQPVPEFSVADNKLTKTLIGHQH